MTTIQRLTLWLAAAVLSAGGARAQTSCPPAPQMPSAEQVQAGMKSARDRGLLWRISKDGHSSYLYGTIHVGRFEWVFPGPAVTRALRETDTLAVELDPTDPATVKVLAEAGAAKAELPAPLRERMHRQAAAACLPAAALGALHPVMQVVALTLQAARWEGLESQFAQELALIGAARNRRTPIVALESAQTQIDALIPKEEPAMHRLLERKLADLETNRVRPLLARLGTVWERGDLAALEDYESWCDCIRNDEERNEMTRLNDGRNPALAERIDAQHRQGRKVFAAVGALHMTGPKSLPRLLAQRGYHVQRIDFAR